MACTFQLVQALVGSPRARIRQYGHFIAICAWDSRVEFARRKIAEIEEDIRRTEAEHRRRLEERRRQLEERRRQLEERRRQQQQQPPPATTATPTEITPSAAEPALPATAPALGRMAVVVGEGSHADVRTMAEALAMVRDDGEIRVLPGRYRETIRITRPVAVRGDTDNPPVFDNLIVNANGAVTLEAIRIEASGGLSALNIEAGDVELINSTVVNRAAARQGNEMTAAIVASAGNLDIKGGTVGPGGNAAILALGHSQLTVQANAVIAGGPGHGLYATGRSRADISDATISGGVAVVIDSRSTAHLSRSRVIGLPNHYVISLSGEATAVIVGNRVFVAVGSRLANATGCNWLRIAPTVPRPTIYGNKTGSNRRLGRPSSRCQRPHEEEGPRPQ